MADEEDLMALQSGVSDLVHGDFRSANLAGQDLKNRDLSGTKFEKANLSSADLSQSSIKKSSFTRANLSGTDISYVQGNQTAFVHVNFSNSKFIESNFNSSHFAGCNFSSADLRGADFTDAYLEDDNNFSNTISDENTRFDGARILRPMIREPVFRYYRLERGRLIRKTEEDILEAPHENDVVQSDVLATIRDAERALSEVEVFASTHGGHGEIGHNAPPDEFALGTKDFSEGRRALDILRDEVESPQPDLERVEAAKKAAFVLMQKAASWSAGKIDLMAGEFMKEAGKNLASPGKMLALYLILSGQWAKLIAAIMRFFG